MIDRFFTLMVLFIVGVGLTLHFDADIPGYLSWIGHLPGDLILRREDAIIYLPFSTAFIGSMGLSILLFMLFGKN